MIDDATLSLVILAITIGVFIWNRVAVEVVALGSALVLFGAGLLTLNETLAGFGDPVVVFIAALFVVSEGLSASGVTAWIGQQVIERAGTGQARVLVVAMLMTAAMTALISLNGAVAALLPVAVILAARTGLAPSRLLMPIAFAGSAGSLLVLTGTPINVIVSDAAVSAGGQPFKFFEFAWAGIPLVIGTVLICVLFGSRTLPTRTPATTPPDLSGYARDLVKQYELAKDLFQLRVRSVSPLIGSDPGEVSRTPFVGVRVIAVRAPGGGLIPSGNPVAHNDLLLVRGDAGSVNRLMIEQRLAIGQEPDQAPALSDDPDVTHVGFLPEPRRPLADTLLSNELGIAEVVVPPRSRLVGEAVEPGLARSGGQQVILAVSRRGEDRPGSTVLAVGDTMLIQGTWASLEQNVTNPDVLIVDSPDHIRRQAAPLGRRAVIAAGVLGVMVVLLSTGVMPPVVAALLGALGMVLMGIVSPEQAYRAIPWTTIILVGGLIPLANAVQTSGGAQIISDAIVNIVGDASPYVLMAVLFIAAGTLGQFISNTATALILIPVAVTAAQALGISERPVLIMMSIACAAAFMTPIATPANMLVMGPGAYKFGDYWKLGWMCFVWFFIIGVFWVPVVWDF